MSGRTEGLLRLSRALSEAWKGVVTHPEFRLLKVLPLEAQRALELQTAEVRISARIVCTGFDRIIFDKIHKNHMTFCHRIPCAQALRRPQETSGAEAKAESRDLATS